MSSRRTATRLDVDEGSFYQTKARSWFSDCPSIKQLFKSSTLSDRACGLSLLGWLIDRILAWLQVTLWQPPCGDDLLSSRLFKDFLAMFCFGSWQNLNHFFVYLLFDTPSYYLRGGTSTTATMHIHHTQRGGTREEHDSRTRDRFARYGFHSETKNKENSIEPVGPGRCCWWSQPA